MEKNNSKSLNKFNYRSRYIVPITDRKITPIIFNWITRKTSWTCWICVCLISHYSNSNRKSNNRGVDKRFESVIPFMKHRCANIGGILQLFLQASFVPLQCSREMIYLRINLIPVVKAVKNRTCSFRSHANLPATLPDALSRMTTIHDTHRLFFWRPSMEI